MADELDLEPIRARLEAAAPGPWEVAKVWGGDWFFDGPYIWDNGPDNTGEPATDKANAVFIANAPTDIAALLAEVERLRKEVP